MRAWFEPGGCREQMRKCQDLADKEDPDWNGNVASVNECFENLERDCISIKEASGNIEVRPSASCAIRARRILTFSLDSGDGTTSPIQMLILLLSHVNSLPEKHFFKVLPSLADDQQTCTAT